MKTRLLFTLPLIVYSIGLTSPLLAQWSSDPMANLGVAVKTSDQVQPKIRPTPDGGCYVSWFDNDPNGNPPYGYDVFLQRLDANGVAQWTAGGIRFADLGMSSTQDYGLDVDADGNALLAFLDDRNHKQGIAVTVMKVTPDGEQVWGTQGRQIGRGPGFKGNPKITATSDGSVVVGWILGNNLVLQRLSGHGGRQWGVQGVTIAAPAGYTYSIADLHAGDNGTAIVSFVSANGFTGPKHLLANKLSTTGALLWGADHVTVFDGGSLQFGNFPPFVTDGAGGAVFGWYEVDPLQSRAQHILADGSEAFPHNGSPGSTDTSHNQVNPSVSYDLATDSTYLFWDDQIPGGLTREGVSGQRFDSTGNQQWGSSGVVIQSVTSDAVLDVESVVTGGNPMVAWSHEANFGQDTITGAKVDGTSGAIICSPFAISSYLSSKSYLDSTLSSDGVMFLAWSDGRNDGGDIYAQDVKPDCSLGQ